MVITDRSTKEEQALTGVVMLTDLRLYFVQSILGKVKQHEVGMLELSSVGSTDNLPAPDHVTCKSDKYHYDFITHRAKDVVAILNETIKNAIENYNNNHFVYDPDNAYKAVECEGCGAVNIVKKNTHRDCEYCGRCVY